MWGFFGKYRGVDEHDTLGALAIAGKRDYFTNFQNYIAVMDGLSTFNFDVSASGEPAPDERALLTTTLVSNASPDARARIKNSEGAVIFTGLDKGYRYNSATVRALIKNRHIHHQPSLIRAVNLVGSITDRSDFINVSAYRNAISCYLGQVPASSGPGSSDSIKGIKGYFSRVKDVYIIPFSVFNFSQFNTIDARFPASLERLAIRASGVAGVINDRLADCVNLKEAIFVSNNVDFQTTPYTNYSQFVGAMVLTGTMSFSHCPNLEVLAIRVSTLTSLLVHASSPFKFFQVNSTTTITASELRTAINVALASSGLAKLYVNDDNLTWTRSFVNGDIASTLVHFYLWGNIVTGSITITTAKATLAHFRIGSNTVSITVAASKNDFAVTSITGITTAIIIDLSNSRISDLTLPVNTTVQELYLGGNKLDTTVNVSLKSQITAMTALRHLWLSAGVSPTTLQPLNANIENGQNSANGIGALDVSALTLLITLAANKSKLTNLLKLPTSIQNVYAIDNNLTGIDTGTLTSLVSFYLSTNPSFNFDFTRVANISLLVASGCAIITCDLSGRTSTATWGSSGSGLEVFDLSGNPVLTSVTFPTTQARAVFAAFSNNSYAIRLNNCATLATLTNQENINFTGGGGGRPFYANDCALNIDFKFMQNNFIPSEVLIQNNAMSVANVGTNITNFFTPRKTKRLTSVNIAGTNGTAVGIYQANAGLKTANITAITKAATAVVSVSAIGTLANNDIIWIRSVTGMTQVNSILNEYMIKNIVGNTFELYDVTGTTPVNSTGYTTYISGGSVWVEGTPTSKKEELYILVNVYAEVWTFN